jgi:hypothetical protein
MTDDQLHELNSLSDLGAAVLDQHFESAQAKGREFSFRESADVTVLRGFVLLMDAVAGAQAWTDPVEEIWAALAGSGVHYSGLFGSLDDGASLQIIRRKYSFAHDALPDPVARQVVHCLRVFRSGASNAIDPALGAAVQRQFSSLLLRYPVLLHPKLLIPVAYSNDTLRYANLGNLLFGSTTGALPRVSHFPDGQAEEYAARIARFARLPFVQRAFDRSIQVSIGNQGEHLSKSDVPLGSLLSMLPAPKVALLASRMEMDALLLSAPDLHDGSGGAANSNSRSLPIPFMSALAANRDFVPPPNHPVAAEYFDEDASISNLNHVLTNSLFKAMGVPVKSSAQLESGVDHEDANFLRCVSQRSDSLLGSERFMNKVEASLMHRVFDIWQDLDAVASVHAHVNLICRGLVDSGISEDLQSGARLVLDCCLGNARPNLRLPQVEGAICVSFLQAIDALGGFGPMDVPHDQLGKTDQADIAFQQLRDSVSTLPAYAIPFRNQWIQALDAFWIEKSMFHVIERARNAAPSDSKAATQVVGPVVSHCSAAMASTDIGGEIAGAALCESAAAADMSAPPVQAPPPTRTRLRL